MTGHDHHTYLLKFNEKQIQRRKLKRLTRLIVETLPWLLKSRTLHPNSRDSIEVPACRLHGRFPQRILKISPEQVALRCSSRGHPP
ncbi:hypothetical protein KC19_VG192000, partial [Ceratodon purpureus]